MRKDKYTEADRLMREGLDGLQPDYPAGGWERLALRLDDQPVASAKEREDEKADELLRASLTSIVPAYEAASWDKLKNRLDTQDSIDAHVLTDESVSQQLNALVPAYDAASWAALNARMNNTESDEILHHRLDTSAPVPPLSGWAALAAKLELIAARRTAIYGYKFSELCLVLTLLLLIWRFYPEGNEVEPVGPSAEPAMEASLPLASIDDEQGDLPPSQMVSTQAETRQTTGAAEVETEAGETAATESAENIPSINIQAVEVAPTVVFTPTFGATNPLAVELAPALLIERTIPRPIVSLSNERNTQSSKPGTFYLRPFISPWDFNQIVTPKQVVNDIILKQDIRISYGASAGVLLDVSYRKHSMQYGLIYGRRSYIPTVLKEVEAFLPGQGPIERRDTNYSRISLQEVTLPVVFQWHVFDNEQWRMTADVGLAANVNVWKRFQKSPNFDSDVLNWSRQTPQIIGGGRNEETEDLNRIGARDLVYPEQGVFQGGSLLENVSMTASIGFSIERYLDERLSIYVAPRFSRAIYYQKSSGVEPFNDRIHNNSVQFGTRILLGKQ
ncbi:hypothetical protein CEQ90_02625 [Lewinellaceae bacterium SD302]|nr:hypothetical protein CEQ90_02625 [Lewinellaceae bacterium SD302]